MSIALSNLISFRVINKINACAQFGKLINKCLSNLFLKLFKRCWARKLSPTGKLKKIKFVTAWLFDLWYIWSFTQSRHLYHAVQVMSSASSSNSVLLQRVMKLILMPSFLPPPEGVLIKTQEKLKITCLFINSCHLFALRGRGWYMYMTSWYDLLLAGKPHWPLNVYKANPLK